MPFTVGWTYTWSQAGSWSSFYPPPSQLAVVALEEPGGTFIWLWKSSCQLSVQSQHGWTASNQNDANELKNWGRPVGWSNLQQHSNDIYYKLQLLGFGRALTLVCKSHSSLPFQFPNRHSPLIMKTPAIFLSAGANSTEEAGGWKAQRNRDSADKSQHVRPLHSVVITNLWHGTYHRWVTTKQKEFTTRSLKEDTSGMICPRQWLQPRNRILQEGKHENGQAECRGTQEWYLKGD